MKRRALLAAAVAAPLASAPPEVGEAMDAMAQAAIDAVRALRQQMQPLTVRYTVYVPGYARTIATGDAP